MDKIQGHIRENTYQRKPQGYDQKHKLFCTNSFVLAESSVKKIYIEQLTLKSSIKWYDMTECEII